MTQELWTEVDRYITDLLVPGDRVLDEALQASDAAGLPPHTALPAIMQYSFSPCPFLA